MQVGRRGVGKLMTVLLWPCPVSETAKRIAAVMEVYIKDFRMNLGMTNDQMQTSLI
jgi:hypothetical protein